MNPTFDWSYLVSVAPLFAKGLGVTIVLALVCNGLAIGAAYLLAAALYFRVPILSAAIRFFVSLIRNTPLLVQMFFIYFGLPELGLLTDSMTTGIIVLTLWATAFQTANLAGAMQTLPAALTESIRALGLRPVSAFPFIVVPVATRTVLPAMMNTMVSTIKNSALLSAIGVPELTFVAIDNIAETYRSLENFFALFVGYLAIVLGLSATMTIMERRLARGERR